MIVPVSGRAQDLAAGFIIWWEELMETLRSTPVHGEDAGTIKLATTPVLGEDASTIKLAANLVHGGDAGTIRMSSRRTGQQPACLIFSG